MGAISNRQTTSMELISTTNNAVVYHSTVSTESGSKVVFEKTDAHYSKMKTDGVKSAHLKIAFYCYNPKNCEAFLEDLPIDLNRLVLLKSIQNIQKADKGKVRNCQSEIIIYKKAGVALCPRWDGVCVGMRACQLLYAAAARCTAESGLPCVRRHRSQPLSTRSRGQPTAAAPCSPRRGR